MAPPFCFFIFNFSFCIVNYALKKRVATVFTVSFPLVFVLFKCAFRPDFKFCKERLFGIFALLEKICANIFLNFYVFGIIHIAPITNRGVWVNMLLIPHESNTVNSEMAEFEMIRTHLFYITGFYDLGLRLTALFA